MPLHFTPTSHASLLLQAGANPKVVSERLGHHSVGFTLDTYAQVLPGMQAAAAAQDFDDLVFPPVPRTESPIIPDKRQGEAGEPCTL